MSWKIGLNFHGIGTPERSLEPGEAPYWIGAALFEDILDRIAASPDPARYVVTFDDGNLSDYTIALPALVSRGLPARFFVLTGRLESAGSLDAAHIRELLAAGMTIGSHGIAHVPWSDLDDTALEEELLRSRAVLEGICGRPVEEAGIPFGRYDARVLRALRRTGYAAAWSSDAGRMKETGFLRPRTSLRHDMTAAEIDAILAGQQPPLRRLRRMLGMAKRRSLPLPLSLPLGRQP